MSTPSVIEVDGQCHRASAGLSTCCCVLVAAHFKKIDYFLVQICYDSCFHMLPQIVPACNPMYV